MAINFKKVESMLRAILKTRDHEIGCAECFKVVDEFIELRLQGANAAEIMPLVQDHLDRCDDCHEEFEALMEAIRATT